MLGLKFDTTFWNKYYKQQTIAFIIPQIYAPGLLLHKINGKIFEICFLLNI